MIHNIKFMKKIIISENQLNMLNNNSITFDKTNDTIVFYIDENEIGQLIFNKAYPDEIENEYSDSIDDFNPKILKFFDYFTPIVNIEDIWVNKEYQGNNLFRTILQIGMDELKKDNKQFILRAHSDNGFPNEKLEQIYASVGFQTLQYTENDGIIMGLK